MSDGVHIGSGLVGVDKLAVVGGAGEEAVDVEEVVQAGWTAAQCLRRHPHVGHNRLHLFVRATCPCVRA